MNETMMYQIGQGGLVEYYLYHYAAGFKSAETTMKHFYEVRELSLDIEDLGERLIGEARENYSVLL